MMLRKEPFLLKRLGLLMMAFVLTGSIMIISKHIIMNQQLSFFIQSSIFMALLGFTLFLFISTFQIFLIKLDNISFTIDKVMDGKFSYVSNHTEDEEGLVSRLEFQFYQMGKRMELNLEKMRQEKESIKSLVTEISHQIKTPLASMKLFTAMLLEDELTDQERTEFYSHIQNRAEELAWLANSLIKISRLEIGVIQLKKEAKDVKETIIQAINGIYLQALEKNIDIHLEDLFSIVVIHDVKWTQEAMLNVLENAVKYTPEHGQVFVRMERLQTYLKIDIEDTGFGIEAHEVGQIFKRFYRGKSPVVANTEGLGIGLYLARRILEEQGGNIIVTSPASQGARFSILLSLCFTKL